MLSEIMEIVISVSVPYDCLLVVCVSLLGKNWNFDDSLVT